MKILFNRTSPVVRSLEAVGVVLSAFYFSRMIFNFDLTAALFLFVFASYVFLRICDWTAWYKPPQKTKTDPGKIGIEVHFQKALVPTSYILTVTALMALLAIPFLSAAVAMLAVVTMLVIVPVNGILIFFHRRDRDPLPMNYFSLNKYKTDEASTNRHDFEKLQASSH